MPNILDRIKARNAAAQAKEEAEFPFEVLPYITHVHWEAKHYAPMITAGTTLYVIREKETGYYWDRAFVDPERAKIEAAWLKTVKDHEKDKWEQDHPAHFKFDPSYAEAVA